MPLRSLPAASRRVLAFVDHELSGPSQSVTQDRNWVAEVGAGVGIATIATTMGVLIPIAGGYALKKALEKMHEAPRARTLPGIVRQARLEEAVGLEFPPGHPNVDHVYAANPCKPDCYVPLADFHRVAFAEKVRELFVLLAGLRVDECTIRVVDGKATRGGVSLQAMIPVDVPVKVGVSGERKTEARTGIAYHAKFKGRGAPAVPDGLAWFAHEPTWQALADGRKRGLREVKVELRYADSFGITAGLAAEVAEFGLKIGGSFQNIEDEHWDITGAFAPKPFFGW